MTEHYPDSLPQCEELLLLFDRLPEMPVPMATAVLNAVVEVYSGWLFPLKVGRIARNKRMIAEFDGGNVRQLCTRYRITTNTFYRILRTSRSDTTSKVP